MPSSSALPPRALAALYTLSVVAAWWIGPDGPVYWDSFGYVIQAITNRAGGLMLGRPAFVLLSHASVGVWRALGGTLASFEPPLRAQWMLVSAIAAPSLAIVAHRVGASARASLLAGLMLALSPSVAHTSRAVLTDGPSMAVSLVAMAIALEATTRASVARMCLAGLALGLAVGMREPSVAHLATIVAFALLSAHRPLALAAAAVVSTLSSVAVGVAWFAVHQRSYLSALSGWGRSMAVERAQHTYGARDFATAIGWIAASGLVPLVGLAIARSRGWRFPGDNRPLSALVALGALQLGALVFYQDIAFSPRYLLTALPTGLFLPCGLALDALWAQRNARNALLIAMVFAALIAGPAMRRVEAPLRHGLRALPSQLASIAPDAAVVTGQLCPAVVFHRELARLSAPTSGARPAWVQVCPGWRWPVSLAARLDELRGGGHQVVIDLRGESWIGERQQRCRDEANRYASTHRESVTLWR